MLKIGLLLCATIAVAMAALIGAAGFGSAALAQSGPTRAIAADDLFAGPESPDFRGGVGKGVSLLTNIVQQAQTPGSQCPTDVDFTVMGGAHSDALIRQALAAARRDAIEAVLRGFGPSVRVTAMPTTSGLVSMVFISAQTAKDKEKPKLDVTWTPPKGTKVSVGTRITAKAVARDDANRWQSGIKTIDLDVQDGGQFGFGDYPQPPQTCENPPPPRTLEGVYRVPASPPPIVRLRARTSDYAGHSAQDIGEFPTGDWHGTIKKTVKGGGHNHTINIDYAFEIERSGTIKGRSRAKIATERGEVPGCTILWTYSPTEFDIPLSGRRDGENFEIEIEPGTTTATIRSVAGGCVTGGGQTSNTFPAHLNPALAAQTKYRITARDGATDTVERTAGALPWGTVMRDTITIHQVRQ